MNGKDTTVRHDTIYSRFHYIACKYAKSPAVTTAEATYTYADIDRLAYYYSISISQQLEQTSLRPIGLRIGVIMDHGVEMIAVILAILRLGCTYVAAEPTFPAGRIQYMMEESGAPLIVTSGDYRKRITGRSRIYTPIAAADALANIREDRMKASDPDIALPETAAYILYTSGTSGYPKGVIVSNANVCHYARAFDNEFHIQPGQDRMLQHSVCSFDIFVEEVFGSLLNGATLAIPPADVRDDIKKLLHFIDEKKVTIVSGFPYLLLDFNNAGKLPDSVRLLISGGDVLRESYINNLLKSKAMIYNTYGPSETTVCATYYRVDNGEVLPDGTYPIGTAVKGANVKVVDDKGREVPHGQVGEIAILGDGVSQGYLRKDVPEQKSFSTTPDGKRIYYSGDMGYMLPSGQLAFLHRKDRQVMILGRRVECDEVCNVLCLCPMVKKGIVTANYDTDGLAYLTAYFVPTCSDFSLEEMKADMAFRLASFMMPEYYVEMPDMPVNDHGKIDRRRLPVILKEGRLHAS